MAQKRKNQRHFRGKERKNKKNYLSYLSPCLTVRCIALMEQYCTLQPATSLAGNQALLYSTLIFYKKT